MNITRLLIDPLSPAVIACCAQGREMTLDRKDSHMDIAGILRDAIAAGTAVMERELVPGGKAADDVCGFSWINVDEAIYKTVRDLGLPDVVVTHNPDLLEPYRLYLKQVSDYQCLHTSLEALQASAAVLRQYGIKAEQEGYLD